MSITSLPTQKTPPVTDLEHLIVYIYGMPGVGKSTFCSEADDSIIIATEAGLNHLTAYKQPVSNWEEFTQVCALIASGNHQFKNVTIDTIDNLFGYCQDYIRRINNVRHEAELPDKRGYSLINGEFKRALTKLSLLPYGLYMVGHARQLECKDRVGGKYPMWVPSLNDTNQKTVVGMSDITLFACIEDQYDEEGQVIGQVNVVHTRPTNSYIAKTRVASLPDPINLRYADFLTAYQQAVRDEVTA